MKSKIAHGLIIRDVAGAIVFFAVVSLLTASTMTLAKVMDPVLAVAAIGAALTVVVLIVFAILKRNSNAPTD